MGLAVFWLKVMVNTTDLQSTEVWDSQNRENFVVDFIQSCNYRQETSV